MAKEKKLCYCCLGDNHLSKDCTRKRVCGIGECKSQHNKLLHQDKAVDRNKDDKERQQKTDEKTTLMVGKDNEMCLKTIPVVLKCGEPKLVVNALLDDGSTKSYINGDVAAQIGAPSGMLRKVQAKVLNGQIETFDTMPVDVTLESLDSQVSIPFTASSTERVTGSLKAVDWNISKKNWSHLKGINFPKPAKKFMVDILIGLDYADLHVALDEVAGNLGEPVARLTPLGWTCVGQPCLSARSSARSFFCGKECNTLSEINMTLRKFWEIENEGLSETKT